MTRKIDADKEINPSKIPDVSRQDQAARPPKNWPGIEGRSQDDEADFVHESHEESAADVTQAQRDLERK